MTPKTALAYAHVVKTPLHKHFKVLMFVFVFLCVIIVYCTFYSVCNTDASDVCAIKITYLLKNVEIK